MMPPRPHAAAIARGLLCHRLFGWAPRLALLATFVLGVLAPVQVTRAEGETESKEQRTPAEEEVEATQATAVRRAAQRMARSSAAAAAFVVARAPRVIAARVEPTDARPQVTLPRRTGPPDDEDDLG